MNEGGFVQPGWSDPNNPEQQSATPAVPAGWYRDPAGGEAERWWTGSAWSDATRAPEPSWGSVPPGPPGPPGPPAPPPSGRQGGRGKLIGFSALGVAVVAGIVVAVVLLTGDDDSPRRNDAASSSSSSSQSASDTPSDFGSSSSSGSSSGSSSPSAPTSVPDETDGFGGSATQGGSASQRRLFLGVVRKNARDADKLSDSQLISEANAACSELGAGKTLLEAAQDGTERNGLSPYDNGVIIGAGIVTFCPQYQSKLPK